MNPIAGGQVPTSGILSFMYFRGFKVDGTPHYHRGIDIPAPLGTPVKAAEGGTVTHTINSYTPGFAGYGKTVVIKSTSKIYCLYGHLDSINTTKGSKVRTGQKIGTVGITAYTDSDPTGNLKNRNPHLHLETSANPYPLPAEAPRLDPVIELRLASSGRMIFLISLFGAWFLIRRYR